MMSPSTSRSSKGLALKIKEEKPKSVPGIVDRTLSQKKSCEISADEIIGMVLNRKKHVHCSFFKVPEPIRRVNSECYKPQLISLGLYGRNPSDERYAAMEKVKQEVASAVLKVLRDSTENEKREVHIKVSGRKRKVQAIWNHLLDKVVPCGQNESRHYIWKQYSDAPPDLSVSTVRHLLLVDAIFLVSFMLFQHADPQSKSFGLAGFEKYEALLQIFTRPFSLCNNNVINSDIWLFENQIPLVLIRRVLREMYLAEVKIVKNAEEKKAASEQAFEILVKKTFQKVLRVLPGNYRTKPGQRTEGCVTDDLLESKKLKKCSHLLDCLYRLVSPVDEKVEKVSDFNSLGHVDSLDHARLLTEEEGDQRNINRWRNLVRMSPVAQLIHIRKERSSEPVMDVEDPKSESTRLGKQNRILLIKEQRSGDERFHRTSMSDSSASERWTSGSGGSGVIGQLDLWAPAISEAEDSKQRANRFGEEATSGVEAASVPGATSFLSPHLQTTASFQKSRLGVDQKSESPAAPAPPSPSRKKKKRASGPNRNIDPVPDLEMGIVTDAVLANGHSSALAEKIPPAAGVREADQEPVLCFLNRILTNLCTRKAAIKIDSYTLPTVAVLREVGIRVKGDSSPGCNCKVELKDSSLPWGSATLHISPLSVDGSTERLLRNLVAFELVSTSEHKLITYLQCLDDLINTEKDVCLLKEGRHPVILNSPLDERDVAKSFNNLLQGCSVYYNPELDAIRKKVRSYYLQQWRRGWTEFKDSYWNGSKPWLAISLFAGFLILSLAAIQTIYTVIGFYKASSNSA
ncbi:hypothetical protein Mapa_012768 [Marchantia paleacea]|nr:hypothetical protein Mapa_012768 [Marchantia paleacea]